MNINEYCSSQNSICTHKLEQCNMMWRNMVVEETGRFRPYQAHRALPMTVKNRWQSGLSSLCLYIIFFFLTCFPGFMGYFCVKRTLSQNFKENKIDRKEFKKNNLTMKFSTINFGNIWEKLPIVHVNIFVSDENKRSEFVGKYKAPKSTIADVIFQKNIYISPEQTQKERPFLFLHSN